MNSAGALQAVLERARARDWAGADPYDGLHSRLGKLAIPLGPVARMVVTQGVLRSPRFRALARPFPSVNPKGLALFLGATVRGSDSLGATRALSLGTELVRKLASLAVRDGRRIAWGYPFPWQSRFLWAPAGTPNAVVTATVGWHLLEWADEAGGNPSDAALARELGSGAALFLSERLNHSDVGSGGSAVSYTAQDSSRIVNVSMLVARLLARARKLETWISPAERERMAAQTTRLLRFTLNSQREDGTWLYSTEARGGWVDSFHTGFVLEALLDLRRWGWNVPDAAIQRGFDAYEGFFDPDGGARLFLDPQSPLDAHSAAQGIVTYAAVAARERAIRIARFGLERLWIRDRGFFAYRIEKGRRLEEEYTRWVQAWMALGMSAALELERTPELQSA